MKPILSVVKQNIPGTDKINIIRWKVGLPYPVGPQCPNLKVRLPSFEKKNSLRLPYRNDAKTAKKSATSGRL